ncbi:putative F-box protein At4g21240 [Impatiens glandulifera]|uniref:putative F-box protein At4g21240 n=1 Tax=Impatiens glandulifera TaxID=253017 RepID=UPI001FB17C95|nr:putative F-box protein At4g21240 [Impatiens glandulifera]
MWIQMTSANTSMMGADQLPENVIHTILKGLPAKTLMQFRCVSKLWKSIVDDPFFIEEHRQHSFSRPDGTKMLVSNFLDDGRCRFSYISEGTPLTQLTHIQTLPSSVNHSYKKYGPHSVNGLVCVGNIIWNPSTRHVLTLPEKVPNAMNYLGFDPNTKQYKVLSIYQACKGPPQQGKPHLTRCMIMTLGIDDSFRDVLGPFPKGLDAVFALPNMCCMDGIMYINGNWNRAILAFDFKIESFYFVPLHPETCHIYTMVQMSAKCITLIDNLNMNTFEFYPEEKHWLKQKGGSNLFIYFSGAFLKEHQRLRETNDYTQDVLDFDNGEINDWVTTRVELSDTLHGTGDTVVQNNLVSLRLNFFPRRPSDLFWNGWRREDGIRTFFSTSQFYLMTHPENLVRLK